MKAYGRRRQEAGCCPGHDKFPDGAYGSRQSQHAKARSDQALHQTARARAKAELAEELKEHQMEGDVGNRSIEVYDRKTKEVVDIVDCGLNDDVTIERMREAMHAQMNISDFGTRVVKTPEPKENGPRLA